MGNREEKPGLSKVYYVRGSGLIPIPLDSMNEVAEIRSKHHEQEVKDAALLARCRRMV